MIKEPLYSNIIMSIKIAKRYKHHHTHHFQNTISSLYQLNPKSSQTAPILISQQQEGNLETLSTQSMENWDIGEHQETGRCLGFFDFPTNISEFEEIHHEQILEEPPTFSDFPSLSDQVDNMGQRQHQ